MSEDATSAASVIRRVDASTDTDLSPVLRYVARECSREDVPLDDWVRTLEATAGSVCLVCTTDDVETYLRWTPGGVRELTVTADGRALRPEPATRVRTQALVASADDVSLRVTPRTPFGAPPGDR